MRRLELIPYGIFALISMTVAITNASPLAEKYENVSIFSQVGVYASHPQLYKGPKDQLWVVFCANTIRTHYGAGPGGIIKNLQAYSPNGGNTWFVEGRDHRFRSLPYRYKGVQLTSDDYVQVYCAANEVVNGTKADQLRKQGIIIKRKWNENRFSVSYRCFLNKWGKNGSSHASTLQIPSVALIQSFAPGLLLHNGSVMVPVYGKQSRLDPATRAWGIRSDDQGETWQLVTIAYDGYHNFSEPALIQLDGGTLTALMRCDSNKHGEESQKTEGFLWQSFSEDGGKTWSDPKRTSIWGYPPNLCLLGDGRVLCTYGYRRPPYGIRACVSKDNGKSWDIAHEIVLRDDGLSQGKKAWPADLGYPSTVQLSDGSLFTVYYFDLGDGITHIAGTRWSLVRE